MSISIAKELVPLLHSSTKGKYGVVMSVSRLSREVAVSLTNNVTVTIALPKGYSKEYWSKGKAVFFNASGIFTPDPTVTKVADPVKLLPAATHSSGSGSNQKPANNL